MRPVIPCVLMRAGTSRGPFFLREWLPADPAERDRVLVAAIGAADPLQLDGLGGGSSLTSKVAIVSRSAQPGCDLDYLFAQVGVGPRAVDMRPNCGNMLSGVLPFAIEQGLVAPTPGTTTARVFNVNTGARIDVTVCTPGGRLSYAGDARIDGVAGSGAPIRLDFLDAWGAVTGSVFPTGRRSDSIDGIAVTCIDAAMPLVIVRASALGLRGDETPLELDADADLLERLEALRRAAGRLMGLGDVSASVVPKPVLVSAGEDATSLTSRYFTPRRCHSSHAVTGAIGVATAFALPGTVASAASALHGRQTVSVLHPAGRIEVEVEVEGRGEQARMVRASLLRTARKIMQGELHLPDEVLEGRQASPRTSDRPITLVVPTASGGGNDLVARLLAPRLGERLGRRVEVDPRAGAEGSIASDFVAGAAPDGHTLLLGYAGPRGLVPGRRSAAPEGADFEPIGPVASSPTLLAVPAHAGVQDLPGLLARLRAAPGRDRYASAGEGTAMHLAGELFKRRAGVAMSALGFDGAVPAIAAALAGEALLVFPSLFTAEPYLRAGSLRALGIAGPQRVSLWPELPTLAECGLDGVDVTQWYALFAPPGTPRPVVERLDAALREVLGQHELVERLEARGARPCPGTSEVLRERVAAEHGRWSRLARQLGLDAEPPMSITLETMETP